MRILKFIGAFLGTLLLILFIVFGFNLDALTTLFKNSADLQEGQQWVSKTTSLKNLTEYIGSQAERVSVVSRSGVNPDTTINFEGDIPRTMGTLSNFFLIATYARLVEAEKIRPDELISLDEVDRYQLPYIDASNHENAKNVLDDKGAINAENKVMLKDLVQESIIQNDLAISDFLFYKLGISSIKQTFKQLNIKDTDLPLPFLGLYITLQPSLYDTSFKSRFSALQKLPTDSYRDTVLAAADKFLHKKQFRKRVNTVFNENNGLGIGFKERRDALSLFPQSTAAQLSALMVQLLQNKLISKSVSGRIRAIMDWPYERQSLNNDFKYYGAIYDNRLGLLNGMDYGASTYSKEPFGQAIFFDSLQVAFWFHMSSTLMHQDYQQRLMWDPALRTTTLKEINNNSG